MGHNKKTAFGNDFGPGKVPQPENAWKWKCSFSPNVSNHFQTIGKLASNDFNHHTEVVNSI
jgi:hypothetical protein